MKVYAIRTSAIQNHIAYTTMPKKEIARLVEITGKPEDRFFATLVTDVHGGDIDLRPGKIGFARNRKEQRAMLEYLLEIEADYKEMMED